MRLLASIVFSLCPAFAQQATYSRDIAPVAQRTCQICHRPGDIAPFALLEYQDWVDHSDAIRPALAGHVMPPWKPVAGHGEFRESYSLADSDRQRILDWIDSGMPEGDAADLPPAAAQSGEWDFGDPDAVLAMPQVYTPPRGGDTYRCFAISTGFADSQYIRAMQIVPGNRQIVHHVLLFIDTSGESAKLDGQDGSPGYTCFGGPGVPLSIGGGLGGWAPGARPFALPDGIAIQVPAKSNLVMQVHYSPQGRPGPDQTKVGLYFSKQPVDRRLFFIPVLNMTFTIPPGESDHEVKAAFTIPPLLDAKAWVIAPHMHLLGRKIRVDLERDSGTIPMILIDDWDFHWQNFYKYLEPVALPAFSTIRLSCHFDNSVSNPNNPNSPPAPVSWGERTVDEMCIAFLGVTFDRENLLPLAVPAVRANK